jgi:DNA-binding transcriptional LysR family regulator
VDLRQLEVFLSVARHLHFGRAADELFLSQPAVSQAIHRLERELGGELFDRTTRRVALTDLGRMFVVEAGAAHAGVVAAYERGRRFAARDATRLVVGYSSDGGGELVALIPEVQRRFPDVAFELRAMRTTEQLRSLSSGEIDAALCWVPQLDERFASANVGTSKLTAMVRDDHPFADRGAVTLAELAAEPLIAWGRSVNPALYDLFAGAMDATGAPWALVGTASGAVDVAARVVSGFGVGVLFESVAAARPIDGVRCVALRDAPAVPKTLVWRADDRSELLGAFIAALCRRSRSSDPAAPSGSSARSSVG